MGFVFTGGQSCFRLSDHVKRTNKDGNKAVSAEECVELLITPLSTVDGLSSTIHQTYVYRTTPELILIHERVDEF